MKVGANDVIHLSDQNNGFTGCATAKGSETIEAFEEWVKDSVQGNQRPWFGDGMPCEYLRPNGEWQKGRLRIRFDWDFEPDVEGLDDLRSQISG